MQIANGCFVEYSKEKNGVVLLPEFVVERQGMSVAIENSIVPIGSPYSFAVLVQLDVGCHYRRHIVLSIVHQIAEGVPVRSIPDEKATLGIILTVRAAHREVDVYGVAVVRPRAVALGLGSHEAGQYDAVHQFALGIVATCMPSPHRSHHTAHTIIDRLVLVGLQQRIVSIAQLTHKGRVVQLSHHRPRAVHRVSIDVALHFP